MEAEPETTTLELGAIGVTSLKRNSGGWYEFDVAVDGRDGQWMQNMTTFIIQVQDDNSTYYFWEVGQTTIIEEG